MRKHVLGLAVCLPLLLVTASPVVAQTSIFSDTWSYEDAQWGGNSSYFFGAGVTDAPYSQNAGAELEIYAPGGALLSYQSAFTGSSYARALITQYVDAENSPEGEYEARTTHWAGQGFLGISFSPISSTRYATRYIYAYTYFTPSGTAVWVYSRMLCGNRCQRDSIEGGAQPGMDPPPYAQGIGVRWSVFGIGWCNITHRPAYNQAATSCRPSW